MFFNMFFSSCIIMGWIWCFIWIALVGIWLKKFLHSRIFHPIGLMGKYTTKSKKMFFEAKHTHSPLVFCNGCKPTVLDTWVVEHLPPWADLELEHPPPDLAGSAMTWRHQSLVWCQHLHPHSCHQLHPEEVKWQLCHQSCTSRWFPMGTYCPPPPKKKQTKTINNNWIKNT